MSFWEDISSSPVDLGLGLLGINSARSENSNQREFARESREFERAFAREQRDFQARREDNAIQRRVADMRLAGINPILSVPQGAASASGAQMARAMSAGSHNPATSFAASVSSGSGLRRASADVRKSDAEVGLIGAQTDEVREKIIRIAELNKLTEGQTRKLEFEINKLVADASKVWAETLNLNYRNAPLAVKTKFLVENDYLIKVQAVTESIGLDAGDIARLTGDIVRAVFGKIKINPAGKVPKRPPARGSSTMQRYLNGE